MPVAIRRKWPVCPFIRPSKARKFRPTHGGHLTVPKKEREKLKILEEMFAFARCQTYGGIIYANIEPKGSTAAVTMSAMFAVRCWCI